MKIRNLVVLILITLLISSSFLSPDLNALTNNRNAKITRIKGNAQVKIQGENSWKPAVKGMVLAQGDSIKTSADSLVYVEISGKSQTATVEIALNSELNFKELKEEEETDTTKILLDLSSGEILIKADKLLTPESKFEVKTPNAVIAVRGTKFAVKVEALE